jgi:hypothetical protein
MWGINFDSGKEKSCIKFLTLLLAHKINILSSLRPIMHCKLMTIHDTGTSPYQLNVMTGPSMLA